MSTTTKFTSGEWRLQYHGNMPGGVELYWLNDRTSIATSNKADAALAHAAPELYEALIAVLEGVNGARAVEDLDCSTEVGGYLLGDVMNDALEAARAALAKVEAPRG